MKGGKYHVATKNCRVILVQTLSLKLFDHKSISHLFIGQLGIIFLQVPRVIILQFFNFSYVKLESDNR